MIYDIVTYNGERELLDLRLNILDSCVDQFFVIEFRETFSGKKKELLFPPEFRRFTRFFKKLTYFSIPENIYFEYLRIAEDSPNVPKNGPLHWRREFCQKESIKWTLSMLQDNDTVFIGDVDEIIDPAKYHEPPLLTKFKLRVYSYWLNNRSNEQFWGPIRARWGDIKDECLNHVRTNAPKSDDYAGWHFTSMGGYRRLKDKLTDSYTSDSYANQYVMDALHYNLKNNRDFLGRDFTYQIDESEWPEYLTQHKIQYSNLCK